MEIREPEFKRGDKVRNLEDGHAYTVESINDYKFMQDEYWYNLYEYWYNLSEHLCIFPESALELYIEKHKTVWDLQNGDTYYAIDYGNMDVNRLAFCNDEYDLNRRALGNCFLKKEEAEYEIERRKIETDMLRLGGKRKGEQGKANWYLEYRPMSGGIEALWSSYETDQGVIYFESEEKAKKAVEIIGKDRIKKYIFGVEE